MEMNLQKQSITINEVVYDSDVEQPVECDALLPDYCPDIVRILKCALTNNIVSTAVNGDRLTIEGISVAHVYYAAAGGGMRHTEYKIPFAKTIDLREAPESPVITVTPSVNYVNCRAVNQRRIDIRGAVTLSVRVSANREEPVIENAEGGGLQLRRDVVKVTGVTGQTECPFSVQEDLDISYGKPAVANIVHTDNRCNITDYRIVSGKVVLKGEFMLHVSWQPAEDNALEVMDYSLPISQIVDCEGIGEDSLCDVQVYIVSCDVMPKADDAGEYRKLTLDARLRASVTAYAHQEIPVATDCYSTEYESNAQVRPVSFTHLHGMIREVAMHKTTLDLPEGLDSVQDVWFDVENVSWKHDPGYLIVTAGITVSMFALMEDGECQYFEQPTELEQKIPISCEGDSIRFDPSCQILSSDYTLSGKEKIDIRCEVAIQGCLYCTLRQNCLGDVTLDENKKKAREKNKLYLYYADEGESVWDIAKHYNTRANGIWDENALEQDILPQKSMLIIPIL